MSHANSDATAPLRGRRRWLGYAGVVAVLLGVVVLLVGGGSLAPDGSIAAIVLGFLTVVLALIFTADRVFVESDGASPPATEAGYRVPVPGAECDPSSGNATRRLAFKRRLSRRVVATLVEERGYSREEAQRLVDEGTWTDDPAAATLLDEGGLDLPLLVRWRWRLRGRDPYVRSARSALDAYEALREREASLEPDDGRDDEPEQRETGPNGREGRP